MAEVTTVKLRQQTKEELDHLRKESESYDAAIHRLIQSLTQKKMRADLIKGYQQMGKEEIDLLEEWDATSLNHDNY